MEQKIALLRMWCGHHYHDCWQNPNFKWLLIEVKDLAHFTKAMEMEVQRKARNYLNINVFFTAAL